MADAAQLDFDILTPPFWTAPAVFNSPHSGRRYDARFLEQSRLSLHQLRRSEDCCIDELFSGCLELGAPMLRAHVPRSYIDLNREPYELDPRLFAEPLPAFANAASPRVAGGLGTIPRIVAENEEIYRRKLPLSEGLSRIEKVYRPYHRALAALLDRIHGETGLALLVDCHSMPSSAANHLPSGNGRSVDVVLGDRFGVSCAEEITAAAERCLHALGLNVVRNRPYAGGFITQNYGSVRAGRHAVQIEVNRALYVNENTLEKLPSFGKLQDALTEMARELIQAVRALEQPQRYAAE
ncbi:MAG: N-formylglutamate amidohydrolase [Aestuariivirga sp.]